LLTSAILTFYNVRTVHQNAVQFGTRNWHMSYFKCAKFHVHIFIIS
jgi:hypothetical protein